VTKTCSSVAAAVLSVKIAIETGIAIIVIINYNVTFAETLNLYQDE